jgi:hypothetical protein
MYQGWFARANSHRISVSSGIKDAFGATKAYIDNAMSIARAVGTPTVRIFVRTESMATIEVNIGVDFIIARIRSWAKSQGLSRTALARLAQLPHHTSLRGFESPTWNPTADMLRRLEALVPNDFYLDATDIALSQPTPEE